ncbi:hypothetical protein [Rugamonas apoptosis]|uniref:Uncharacterized protein n=1 Tax=Rugamonas apoptosis TaxID=2758570 RepID=A0A7W2IJW5_9BURK|nr:hypothetical protein [Rugamonas apoptosis]MBA5686701.1 hypothetical protein [Rugamonas apoptosis]
MKGKLTAREIAALRAAILPQRIDWILNDPHFGAKSLSELKKEIFGARILLVCSDLANGTKHFRLDNPKTDITLSSRTGFHVDPALGIFQEHFYIIAPCTNDAFHRKEVRDFLLECRDTWRRIIRQALFVVRR